MLALTLSIQQPFSRSGSMPVLGDLSGCKLDYFAFVVASGIKGGFLIHYTIHKHQVKSYNKDFVH